MAENGSGLRLAVDRISDDAFIGWCAVNRWNPGLPQRITRRRRLGHGYATEAAGALLDWFFGALPLHRVQALTGTRDLASARVLEKLGFRREGTLREDCIVHDETSDSWRYGMLRRDRPRAGV